MAKKKGEIQDNGGDGDVLGDEGDVIDMVPLDRLPPPPQMAPATDAERKTEDLWERMLGTDDAGTGYVTIHRLTNGTGAAEDFVEKFASDRMGYEDILEYLRENYGPGEYRMRLYVKTGRGNFVLRANRSSTIVKRMTSTMPAVRDAARTGQEMTTVLATFEAMQQRSQQQMADMVERIERRNAQPQRNSTIEMIETIAGFATAIGPLLPLIMGNRTPATDPLDTLTKLMSIQRQLQPAPGAVIEGDGGDNIMGVVKAGIMALPAILSARNDTTRRALPSPPPQAAPRKPLAPTFDPVDTRPPAAASAPAQTESDVDDGAMMPVDRNKGDRLHPLHGTLCDLLNAAAAWQNSGEPEPAQVAKMVMDNLSAAHQPVFRAFLEASTLVKDLVAIHPDAIDHVEWLLAMRDEVLDLMDGELGDEVDADLQEDTVQGYDQATETPPDAETPTDVGLDRQEDHPPQTA